MDGEMALAVIFNILHDMPSGPVDLVVSIDDRTTQMVGTNIDGVQWGNSWWALIKTIGEEGVEGISFLLFHRVTMWKNWDGGDCLLRIFTVFQNCFGSRGSSFRKYSALASLIRDRTLFLRRFYLSLISGNLFAFLQKLLLLLIDWMTIPLFNQGRTSGGKYWHTHYHQVLGMHSSMQTHSAIAPMSGQYHQRGERLTEISWRAFEKSAWA